MAAAPTPQPRPAGTDIPSVEVTDLHVVPYEGRTDDLVRVTAGDTTYTYRITEARTTARRLPRAPDLPEVQCDPLERTVRGTGPIRVTAGAPPFRRR